MSVVTIGSRLMRTFGEGKNLRKIVTECVDGKTYTKVLGADGEILIDRVKAFERSTVGNKKVLTTIKINQNDSGVVSKSVYDRVYDRYGHFRGAREVFTPDIDCCEQFSAKISDVHIFFQEKRFINGIVCSKQAKLGFARSIPSRLVRRDGMTLAYNKKGLPLPQSSANAKVNFDEMSLKEMRNWHIKNCPELPYAQMYFNLKALDNREIGSTLERINDLDKYL